jgi:pimeloyl-ACP methyl ester carboxylesterase
MTWNAVAPRIAAAESPSCRLIAVDQRGSGTSDQPASGYDIDAFAGDIEQICALEGLRRVSLVGHSRGGWLAAYMAGMRPELVRRLILLDPARISYDSEDDADEFYGRVRASLGPFATLEAAVAQARDREPRAKWTAEREESLVAGLTQHVDGTWANRTSVETIEQLRVARGDGARIRDTVARVLAPTLMLVSSQSPDRRQAQKLEYANLIPTTEVHYIDATHHIHQDEPELTTSLIVSFLRKHDGAGA